MVRFTIGILGIAAAAVLGFPASVAIAASAPGLAFAPTSVPASPYLLLPANLSTIEVSTPQASSGSGTSQTSGGGTFPSTGSSGSTFASPGYAPYLPQQLSLSGGLIGGTGSTGSTESTGSTVATLPAAAAQLVALTNQDRAAHGLPPLTVSAQLTTLAQERAVAMVQYNYFTHDSPIYGWPIQMEAAAGVQAEWLGAENIVEAPSTDVANQEFLASPPHLSNILGSEFTQIGIGVASMPGGWIAVSELFSGPSL
jgi:uncharacterized protein YkwD